jgi:hypothetical protein
MEGYGEGTSRMEIEMNMAEEQNNIARLQAENNQLRELLREILNGWSYRINLGLLERIREALK